MVQRIKNRKRELTFSHIITRGLTNLFGVVIIKDIITDLEDGTDNTAEPSNLLNIIHGKTCGKCTDDTARLEQSTSLILNDLEVFLFRKTVFIGVCKLKNFTVSKRHTQLSNLTEDGFLVRHADMKKCGRKNIIANQHGHLIIITSVHRLLTTSFLRFIHHIIMHQTCRMK